MIVLRIIVGFVLLFFARWGLDTAIHAVRIAPGVIGLKGWRALPRVILGGLVSLGLAVLLCFLAVLVFKLDVMVPSMWVWSIFLFLACTVRVWSWVTKKPHLKGELRLIWWELWILLVIFAILAQVTEH